MKIKHPNCHRWFKNTLSDPLEHFGKNNKARLRSTLAKIDQSNITHEVKSVNEEFLEWFLPLYHDRINEKNNPRIIDIADKTIHTPQHNYQYLALYENNKPLGATIFRLRKKDLMVAWRTYKNEWETHSFQAKPSLYTEHLISKIAYEYEKEKICHGKDNNPYGIFSSIGLAAFKLSGGSHPELTNKYEECFIETEDINSDALIMSFPEEGTKIKKAYLVTKRENENKYTQLQKTPHLLQIEVIYRD